MNKLKFLSLAVLLVLIPLNSAQTATQCKNLNDFVCNLSKGLCQSDINKLGTTVSQYCPLTCGLCTPDGTNIEQCTDEYTGLCTLFKKHCNLFSSSLDHPCKKTCLICQ